MHWFVRLFACYLAVVCQLCLATEYPVIARKGPDLQQTDLGATAKGSTTPTLSLNSVRIPTVSDFVAGSNVSITTSGATVTIAATATDNGITTATLTGAGVVDVTTSGTNYAMIGVSSLSPRTDQMTTWTATFTAPDIYVSGKYYGDGSELTGIAANHNDLAGIQGGAAADYYHITQAQEEQLHQQHTDIGTDNASFVVGGGTDAAASDVALHLGGVNGLVLQADASFDALATSSPLWVSYLGLWLDGEYGAWGGTLHVAGDYSMTYEGINPRMYNYSPTIYWNDFDEGADYALTYVIGTGLQFDGNMVADHFVGDGSMLTNLPSGGADGVGITTATLTGGGVVDVTTSAPEYAMISLSSLSPRTDRDTTFTGGLEAAYLYGDGSAITGITASAVLSTSTLELTDQATTPSLPAPGYSTIWVNSPVGAGGIDRYTSLLLHGDGSDGSKDIVDSSMKSHSYTVTGNVHCETDQAKFGVSSLYFDAVGDYILATLYDNTSDLGNGDWTIDFWARPDTQIDAYPTIMAAGTWTTGHFQVYADKTSPVGFGAQTHRGAGGEDSVHTATGVTVGTWQHIAIERVGNQLWLFEGGTLVSTDTLSMNISFNKANAFAIGSYPAYDADHGYKGYLDEIRISKGIARWTSNFTPPTQAYGKAESINILTSDGTNVWH